MPNPATPPLIACVNSSADIVELLADVFRDEGFRAVSHASPTGAGVGPSLAFLRDLQPLVCVFNISIPYAASWAEFQTIRQALPTIGFVIVTTNKEALENIVGPTNSLEIIGKPFDLHEVDAAVRRLIEAS